MIYNIIYNLDRLRRVDAAGRIEILRTCPEVTTAFEVGFGFGFVERVRII